MKIYSAHIWLSRALQSENYIKNMIWWKAVKYINIMRHSKMSLYRPRSEWIITDKCCPRNIYFASKLQGTLTYCCYFPLYCPPSSEKYKMKNHIHKCSRVTLWHTVTTYNEILTYRCQRIDHEELSLDDAICLVTQFTSCIAEPSEYFPQRFSTEWPRIAFKDYWQWYVHMTAYPFQ